MPLDPFGAVFVVTSRCNSRCRMCQIWNQNTPDSHIDTYVSIVRQPLFRHIVNVAITGGEPTLRNDLDTLFEGILTACPRLNSVNISTNAFLPDRLEKIARNFIRIRDKLNPNVRLIIQISLDGTEDLHDRIRGVPGGFRNVMESRTRMERLFSATPNCEFYHLCVLQPDNIPFLETIEPFFESLNTQTIFNFVNDVSYVLPNPESAPTLTPAMEQSLIAFYRKKLRTDPDPRHHYHYQEFIDWLELGYRPRVCGLLSQHIIINHDGHLLPCLNCRDITYPRLSGPEMYGEFWKSGQRRDINRQIRTKICPACRAPCGPNTFDAVFALLRKGIQKRLHQK